MQIVDNLIEPSLVNESRRFIESSPSLYGWKAHSSANGSFWHQNHVLPGKYEHHYESGVWHPDLSYDEFVRGGSPLSKVAKVICENLFGGVELTRVWVNLQTFGDESAFHRDFPDQFKGSALTAVWYPVESWDRDWGGDFVTLNDDGEIENCAMVRPNRIVVFDGTTPHSARPISRYCNAVRIAVSFACEVVK